ncbi:MAG: diguanylate cyclase [Candidatus Omnitrophica bacterium]|nr:diguanylate cyclase [Candidatus Omnitrophota bacterium]
MDEKNINILLVEDDKLDASFMTEMLKNAKKVRFNVEVCDTLTKALGHLVKGGIDLVLLDLTLPDSIGLDTFGRMHAHVPKVPIIVMTSFADEEQTAAAFQKGAQDYLVKGQINTDLLTRSIRYAIERNKTRVELRDVEEKIEKINSCFLGFTEDPSENICRLTALFGELLGASCALYNCIDRDGILCSIGQWNTPKGYKPRGKPGGHICYDVINKAKGEMFLVRDLQDSPYARTDPNVKLYNLKTYIGYPIKWRDKNVGSLCAVYERDFIPTEEDKKMVNIIAAAVEVEEKRRHAEEELRESEERFRIIFESTSDCIIVWDKDYNYIYANQAAIDHVGTTRDKVIGKNIRDGLGHIPDFMRLWMERVDKVFRTQKPMKVEDSITIGGRLVYSESVLSPIRNEAGDVFAVGVVYRDVTDRKYAENKVYKMNKELTASNKKLNQLTLRDPQTGLYNHSYLEKILDAEFYRAKRYNHALSIIMIDVDYFKSINEVYGYKFGDMILKQLAHEVRKIVRKYDVVIRYGGEEFMVISPDTDRNQAAILAQRILDSVSIHSFGNAKTAIKLKMSLAAVSYPEDRANNAMELIKSAENMLDKAKEAGGDRIFSSMNKKSAKGMAIAGKDDVDILKKRLEGLNKEVNQSLVESIFAFAKAIELKDHYTGEHVEKTVKYATDIAKALGLGIPEVEMVKQAAMLHDLGKLGVSESILTKKAKLTKKEVEEIRKHPRIAADILRPIHVLNAIVPFILYHHERWDGKGYPDGLRGEEIPLGARIVAIADVYQALISHRSYRKAFSKEEAINMIKKASGTQFDPRIVNIFLSLVSKEKSR